MADILQITEDIPVDDSIYDYEYKEYNPIVGTDLNRGSIVIVIEAQDIYTHPSESFLIIEGQLVKNVDANTAYTEEEFINLINNGIMYLFSDIRFHLASHEIEVLQNPGHATTMLGMLKYPDDFNKSQGLNQAWAPDTEAYQKEQPFLVADKNKKLLARNDGFKMRFNYIIKSPDTKGNFSFKIPLKHFLGFCEDYKKIIYGMQQRLTLTRTGNNNAIYRGAYNTGDGPNYGARVDDRRADEGKVNLKK